MVIKNIGFDIDGTLIDELSYSVEVFLQKYTETYQKKYLGLIDQTKLNVCDRFPDCDSDFLKGFESYYWNKYLKEAPFRPYVKELFQKLKQMGATIHIVTARFPDYGHNEESLEAITKQRFEEEGIPVDVFHIGISQKEAVISGNDIELLVEDSPEQLINVSEKIPTFVFHCPYNSYLRGKNIWRIDTYEPDIFIENLKYAMKHVDNWDLEYKDPTKEKGIEFQISDSGIITFNSKNLQKKNICFVLPFGNPTDDSFAKKLSLKLQNTTMIDLNKIDEDPDKSSSELVVKVIRKCNPKKIDLTDINSTDVYQIKCAIIEDLLAYASKKSSKSFIFFGIQLLMLKRDATEKFKEYPIFVCGAGKKECDMLKTSRYREGYNPWILFEDFTEVATQIRKWKIIAGTAPKELKGYINRQTSTSEGIDIVRLLPGEAPYNERELQAKLSMDTYILGDCHLSTKDPEKTKRILSSINQTVKKHDVLLFLGDFDGKKGTGSYDLTKDFIQKLVCENIYLILGNNDPYTIDEYKSMGFRAVTDMVSFRESPEREIILTHCAYPTEHGQINIHGHIHGSRCYWNMDCRDHYDVWDEDFVPIKMRDCISILDNDQYVAHTEIHNIY